MDPNVLEYLRSKNIQYMLNDLVTDMIKDMPENVTVYAENWFHKINNIEDAENQKNINNDTQNDDINPPTTSDGELSLETKYTSPVGLYELKGILGKGHYAEVREAVRLQDGVSVAIKILPVTGKWVTWEYDALVHCKDDTSGGDHVVRVLDCHYHKEKNEFWIVMEKLVKTFEGFKPSSEDEIRRLLFQLTKTMAWIHERGYVHLDVKPANLLRRDENTHVVVADFGTAMYVNDPIEQLGDFVFMAPEVYREVGYYSGANDVWGIGITALCFANGASPFPNTADFDEEKRFSFFEGCCVSPCLREPYMWSMEFVDFIAKCFVMDPEQRETAESLCRHPFFSSLM
eukprot:PhF_6_TR37832/c0_g1_i1/m.56315